MDEFDADIQRDLDAGNLLALAYVAQDLRDTLKYVNGRALIAAHRRKSAAARFAEDTDG